MSDAKPLEIPADLPGPLLPLAWMLGRWEGAGVVGYPTMAERRFGQEVEVHHDGRPFLHWRSQAFLLDDDGEVTEEFLVPELDGTQGRIRSVRQGVDGALYATTDNGADDRLLRITPR